MRYTGPYINLRRQLDKQNIVHAEVEEIDKQLIDTTVGRVIFNMHLPKEIPFINGLLKKRGLQDLVSYCFIKLGNEATVRMLDEIKEISLPVRHQGRHFVRRRRHGRAEPQEGDPRPGARRGHRDRESALGGVITAG